MIEVLLLTIGLKRSDFAVPADLAKKQTHQLLSRLRVLQGKQGAALDMHLKEGWTVLHVTDAEDQHGWYSMYTLHKPDLVPQPVAVESENDSLDLSALNGDGDGFAPAGDEFGAYGDLAADVRRGYVAARSEDETC